MNMIHYVLFKIFKTFMYSLVRLTGIFYQLNWIEKSILIGLIGSFAYWIFYGHKKHI